MIQLFNKDIFLINRIIIIKYLWKNCSFIKRRAIILFFITYKKPFSYYYKENKYKVIIEKSNTFNIIYYPWLFQKISKSNKNLSFISQQNNLKKYFVKKLYILYYSRLICLNKNK